MIFWCSYKSNGSAGMRADASMMMRFMPSKDTVVPLIPSTVQTSNPWLEVVEFPSAAGRTVREQFPVVIGVGVGGEGMEAREQLPVVIGVGVGGEWMRGVFNMYAKMIAVTHRMRVTEGAAEGAVVVTVVELAMVFYIFDFDHFTPRPRPRVTGGGGGGGGGTWRTSLARARQTGFFSCSLARGCVFLFLARARVWFFSYSRECGSGTSSRNSSSFFFLRESGVCTEGIKRPPEFQKTKKKRGLR